VNAKSLEELAANTAFIEVRSNYNQSLDKYVIGKV
jgi:hypothetical protein